MKLIFNNSSWLKISLFIFFIFISSKLFATDPNQKISINVQKVTLKEFFKQIELKTDYTVVYRDALIEEKNDISVNVVNKPLVEVLNIVLGSRGLQSVFNNNTITITKKNTIPQTTNKNKKISGVVLDEKDLPIIGASVLVVGTSIGTATDINGRFIVNVPSNAKLRISYVGYDSKTEDIGDKSELKVTLEPTPRVLNELVITAQAIGQRNAIQQQINSTTIKNVVAADRLQENPDANSVEAIGRLPGISVQRSGGEGVGLVIRGLEPRYSSVTLNGIQLPSIGGGDRGTNLSGISQYALQGAEVYKSLTADMEANSVAGTVNLKLREAPKDFHMNIMAQMGYNNLNNYWGNYKFLGEFSNRFFDDKLGVLFTANAERVNRSIQIMSAGYDINSRDPNVGFSIFGIGLNDIKKIIYRRSAMLSLDYKLTDNTTLMLYGMYSNSKDENQTQSKNYSVTGTGTVGYSFSITPNAQINMFQGALNGDSKFKFLKMKADYGISFSVGKNYNLGSRSWNFVFDDASPSTGATPEIRKLYPQDIILLFTDDPDKLLNCRLDNFGMSNSRIDDKNINAHINLSIPFTASDNISGNFKFGGLFKIKTRLKDDIVGGQFAYANYNVALPKLLVDSLDWIVLSPKDEISAVGLTNGKIDNFLNGQFNFGNTFSFDRLNQISDVWERISNYYFNQGPAVFLPVFGAENKLGYTQNVNGSSMGDQNIRDYYSAGYLMSEINIGKYFMFLPGVRLENTHSKMKGFYAMPLQQNPSLGAPLPGKDTSAVRSDQFILPMIHLRIKPVDYFYIHLAYTKTLSRPDFNVISPNYFVNTGYGPFSYTANNPAIRPETWTNLDAQFVFHGKKIGLLSLNMFYKTVIDKIWGRSYKRVKGDPIVGPFPDNAVVNVSITENHPYKGYVRGFETEWQTSFFFLPKPFCYLTLTANYTLIDSKTNYSSSRIAYVVPPGGVRPVAVRIDSVITGRMRFQPKHIGNVSLGYNKNGLNVWLSFQYNGQVYISKDENGVPRKDAQKDYFYRWDLQIAQKFSIKKISGFEMILNIANLSDFTESQRFIGDPRPTYQENYGWTSDLGLRFRF